jgi:hypothetical protein
MAIALHTLSAIGGIFGLWIVARSLRDFRRGLREGIKCHLLKCSHCGKTIEWADDAGCTRDR